jgi:hypothetical protein
MGHVLAALSLGTALGACFNPPAAAVMFSCPDAASPCPAGYSCEADGCCHRDGSDVAADYGACGLGGPATGPLPGDTSTGTTDDSTSTDASTAPTTGSSSTGTPDLSTTGDTTGTSGADTSDSTGASTSASTGP